MNTKRYNKAKGKIDTYESIKQYPFLVRLQTGEKKIKLLQKNGKALEAEKVQKEIDSLNNEIITAYHKHFNFAKVYFFYSTYGKQLKAGTYSQIPFFDADRNPVTDLEIVENQYYVSEFSRSYSEMIVRENEDGSKTLVAGSNPYPAVVIMTPDYIPLRSIVTNGIYSFRNPSTAIQEMDFALKKDFARTMGKLKKLELKMKMHELRQ